MLRLRESYFDDVSEPSFVGCFGIFACSLRKHIFVSEGPWSERLSSLDEICFNWLQLLLLSTSGPTSHLSPYDGPHCDFIWFEVDSQDVTTIRNQNGSAVGTILVGCMSPLYETKCFGGGDDPGRVLGLIRGRSSPARPPSLQINLNEQIGPTTFISTGIWHQKFGQSLRGFSWSRFLVPESCYAWVGQGSWAARLVYLLF